MSPRLVLVAAVLAPLAVAACATPVHETPPERPLFRLRAAQVLSSAEVVVADEPPSGPPVDAWQAQLEIRRADGTVISSPRVVVLPGRRATMDVVERISYIRDFDVTVEGDTWVADPIIGTLAPGIAVEVAVLDVEGGAAGIGDARRAETALAWKITASDLRRPVASRSIGALSTAAEGEVSLQFPRSESAEASGARRVPVGEGTEIARLPDPSGGGELVVRARIDRVTVPGPALHAEPPATGTKDAEDLRLLALGRAAAAGDRTRSIRVTAVRLPPGVEDANSQGVERLARLSVSSVLAPGVRGADLLREAYLSNWGVDVNARGGAFDPVVATHESGLSAEVADAAGGGRSLVLRWRTTPNWERLHFAPGGTRSANLRSGESPVDPSFHLPLDVPESLAVERTIPLDPGRTVHPVFRLPDGGTAALVVEAD